MAITKDKSFVESKKLVLDDIKQAWLCDTEIEHASDFAETGIVIKELPLTEDGVNLNFGSVNLTYKKTSTGLVWGSKVDRDDPEVSMNICNVAEDLSNMFMEKKDESTADVTIGDDTFAAVGYASKTIAKKGSLWLPAENGEGWIVLPKVSLYGTLNGTTDSDTSYYETQVVPAVNADGCSLYFLSKTGTTTSATLYHVYIQYNDNSEIVADFWAKDGADVVNKAKAAGWTVSPAPGVMTNKMIVKATAKIG